MKQLISFHDMTDEGEIDGVVQEIMKGLGQEAPTEPVEKHTPGGKEHEQAGHGNWSDGSGEDQPPQGRQGTQGLPAGNNSVMSLPTEVPREDAAFVQEVHQKYLAQVGPRLEHVAQNAGMDQMSVEGERRGIDTMGMYGVWEGNDFKGYDKARAEWQAGVLAQMEAEQAAANGQQPGKGSKAVVMLGNPGAGKTYLIGSELNQHVDTRDFLTINADAIKEKLIFEDTPPDIEGVDGMELSSMVHEESSGMRKAWEKNAMMDGTNVIFDITGANGGKTETLLGKLGDLGYDVTLVHADVTPAEAAASALRRAAVGGDPETGELGRIVPLPFIESMKVGEGVDKIDQQFDDYLPYVNQAMWFRTYPLNVERSKGEEKPIELLWSSS